MATTYSRYGASFNHTATADVESNDVVVQGTLAGVAVADIATGSTGTVAIEGVWRLPARTGVAFAQGEALAWDVSLSRVIKSSAATAGDIDNFGKAMEAKASADDTVDVLVTVQTQAIHA